MKGKVNLARMTKVFSEEIQRSPIEQDDRPALVRKGVATAPAQTLPPYIVEVEVNCEECGGSGFDPGGVDPWGPEPCVVCRGSKTQRTVRNFLAEAFQIAAKPESSRQVERQHLVAIIHHCRELVSALVILPEVARGRSDDPAEPYGSAKPITHFKRRKHEITFSPQRVRSRKRAAAGG
jgi:hypothetical protein